MIENGIKFRFYVQCVLALHVLGSSTINWMEKQILHLHAEPTEVFCEV